jgi:hypothetical protein
LPTTANFACVLSYRKTDTTFRNTSGWGIVDGGTLANRCHAHMPFTDGTVYFDYGGATSGATRVSVAGLTFGNDVWAFTVGARGMEIWQNGVRKASNTATPTRTNSGNPFRLFGGSGDADLAESDFIRVYSAQPDTGVLAWMGVEPYAMLRPLVRRRYFVPTGAVTSTPMGLQFLLTGIGR